VVVRGVVMGRVVVRMVRGDEAGLRVALAACDELPGRIADGFRAAPSSSVRFMADGLERGLTAMRAALMHHFSF